MKTRKIFISLCFITAFLAVGLSKANAQVFQNKDYPWEGYLWVGCANGGQGEWLYGTLHQHLVVHFDKEGNQVKTHFNYIKSEFQGLESEEVFTVFGASNMGPTPNSLFDFNEALILMGDKGTKVVIKTKWSVNLEGEWEMKLFFEKCI